MLKFTLTALLLLLLTACSSQTNTSDSNNKINLAHLKGKWLIVNYWATWCKPCLKEMPALNNVHKKNKNKLVVLGVSFDKLPTKDLNDIKKTLSIQYPLLTTFPAQKYKLPRITVLPITFIINPAGKLVKTLKGPHTEAQFLKALQNP